MSRPTLEVADIVRAVGKQILGEAQVASCMVAPQVLDAILRSAPRHWAGILISASTAAIHLIQHAVIATAPSAIGNARAKCWRAFAELLPVPYFHIVFSPATTNFLSGPSEQAADL